MREGNEEVGESFEGEDRRWRMLEAKERRRGCGGRGIGREAGERERQVDVKDEIRGSMVRGLEVIVDEGGLAGFAWSWGCVVGGGGGVGGD